MGCEVRDELTKQMEEANPDNVTKKMEGGLEGVPEARQLTQMGYRLKKKQRTNGTICIRYEQICSDIT